MKNKKIEALITGIVLWGFGAASVLLFGNNKFFIQAAVPTPFLTAPVIYYLTKFHLRNVGTEVKSVTAIQFGVIITLVQFPLDLLIWLSSFNLGYPKFSQAISQTIIIVLQIAYFIMLAVPYFFVVYNGKEGR